MSLEGSLIVRLDWADRRVRTASVRSTRPLATPRVLRGRAPAEAVAMTPLLYSVCAFAQGGAAAAALGAALGRAPDARVETARRRAVALEALQEDLQRLLIGVPAVLGLVPDVASVAAARRAIAPLLAAAKVALALDASVDVDHADAPAVAELRRVVEASVLGMPAEAFAALATADAFVAWAAQGRTLPARVVADLLARAPKLGASDVPPMPEPTARSVAAAVLAALDAEPGFAAAPRWDGTPVETGALARATDHAGLASFVAMYGGGVAARLLARALDAARTLLTLADAPARLCAWSPTEGEGVALVQTARGLLLHRTRVRDARVADYAIVAPTEWNFHPQGALVRGLAGLAADTREALMRDAGLVVQSLDPCVACDVEVVHA